MADPVLIEIRMDNHVWVMTRAGEPVRSYGHADLAVHAAVRLARDLIHSGEPAEVRVEAAGARTITIDLDEPQRVATPGEDETSAVIPDRSANA